MELLNSDEDLEEVVETIFMTKRGSRKDDPDLDFDVILDNGATSSLIRNQNLLDDIRVTKIPTVVQGINGNDDGLKISHCGTFGPFGEVLYHREVTANILSLPKVQLTHEVSFDSANNSFTVSKDDKTYHFKVNHGLYTCNLQPHDSDQHDKIYSSHENKNNFKASLVKLIQKRLGYISDQALIKAIVDSSIRNLPLDVRDVPLARKINGPTIESLKGKSHSLDPRFPRQINLPRDTKRSIP
jgi:hypothetical protein